MLEGSGCYSGEYHKVSSMACVIYYANGSVVGFIMGKSQVSMPFSSLPQSPCFVCQRQTISFILCIRHKYIYIIIIVYACLLVSLQKMTGLSIPCPNVRLALFCLSKANNIFHTVH